MQKSTFSEGSLIVVELGAEWPSLSDEGASNAPAGARRVLAQDATESPATFAIRVGEQVDSLFGRGVSLGSAVIACSERLDEQAQGARAELARAAAGAMARARGGRLVLSASDRNEGRSRRVLGSLVSELAKEWQSGAVEAKLRFVGEAAPVDTSTSAPSPASRRGRDSRKPNARRVA